LADLLAGCAARITGAGTGGRAGPSALGARRLCAGGGVETVDGSCPLVGRPGHSQKLACGTWQVRATIPAR